jgi:hypothetical protein
LNKKAGGNSIEYAIMKIQPQFLQFSRSFQELRRLHGLIHGGDRKSFKRSGDQLKLSVDEIAKEVGFCEVVTFWLLEFRDLFSSHESSQLFPQCQ